MTRGLVCIGLLGALWACSGGGSATSGSTSATSGASSVTSSGAASSSGARTATAGASSSGTGGASSSGASSTGGSTGTGSSSGGLSSGTTTSSDCPTSTPPSTVCQEAGCEARIIATAVGRIAGLNLAVDADNVYWVVGTFGESPNATSALEAVSIDGGSAVALVFGVNIILGIVVDGPDLYWSSSAQGQNDTLDAGGLFEMPIAGGPTKILATEVAGDDPQNIQIEGGEMFWVNSDDGIQSAPLDGGQAVQIAAPSVSETSGMAVDAANVYWNASREGTVNRVPVDGGEVVQIASLLVGLAGMAVDSQNVYWFANSFGAGGHTAQNVIQAMPVDGGMITTLVSTQAYSIVSLAADGNSVYWGTDGYSGRTADLMKLSLDAGTTSTLVAGALPSWIAVDATSLYWGSNGETAMVNPPPPPTCPPTNSYVLKLTPK